MEEEGEGEEIYHDDIDSSKTISEAVQDIIERTPADSLANIYVDEGDGLGNSDAEDRGVKKLDLLNLCFSLNFYFLICPLQFPSMFPFLTHSQSFILLSADCQGHSTLSSQRV